MGWDRTKRDEPIWDGGEGTGDETDRTEWDEIRTGPLVDVMKCLSMSGSLFPMSERAAPKREELLVQ